MITKFDAAQPIAGSRIQSAPIRTNFVALNERTDQLTPSATDPVSTSINVGNGLNIYFEDNSYTPFTGIALDLGSVTSGVSNFNNPGTFKEIIVYFVRDSFGDGQLGFIESVELSVRNHSTSTAAALINDINAQRVPNATTGVSQTVPDLVDDISPLDDAVIICSIIVTNNGQTGQRGAISPIFDSDIIDCRPFLQRTFSTKTIEAAVEAATTSVKVANSQVNLDNRVTTISGSVVNSTTVTVASSLIAASLDPTSLGFNPVVRISTNTLANAASADGGTTFVTATVLSVAGSVLTLSNPVTASSGAILIRGQFTEDRLAFDLVNSFGNLMERDPAPDDPSITDVRLKAPVNIQNLSNGALLKLESSSSDGYFGIRVPSSIGSLVNTDWLLPSDEPTVGDVISVDSLGGGLATLKWSSPAITTLQQAYDNSVDGYLTTSGTKDVVIDGTRSVIIDAAGGLSVPTGIVANVTGNLTGNADTATSATTATNFSGSLSGDVTGTQAATVVSLINGVSSSLIKDAYDGYHVFAPDIVSNTAHRNLVSGNPHMVTINEVDGYSKIDIDGYLDAKADLGHTHVSADITDLIDGYSKIDIDGYLDAKADLGHTHTAAEITTGTFSGNYAFGGLLSFTPSAVYADGDTIGTTHPNDKVFIRFDSTDLGGPGVTLSLPASPTSGQLLIIKDVVGAGTWDLLGNTNTIDGSASLTGLSARASVMLLYDGIGDWAEIS